jgi:hypothetical protein
MARKPGRKRSEAAEARRGGTPRTPARRAVWILLLLGGVLALQLWICRGRFGLPFLDTRLHYDYDSADFSFRARCGNRDGTLRSQFGVTADTYSRWGEKTGDPTYYTDHPFLLKALFQQFTRVAGAGEWASRAFSFVVSFGIAAGLYTLLLQTTGSLFGSLAGAAILVSLPLFAVYQTSLKFEADGMLAGVWLFVAMTAFLKTGRPRSLKVYGALVAIGVLAHWTAALFAAALAAGLLIVWLRTRDPRFRDALLATAAGGLGGGAALAGLMSYIQGGWRAAWGHLARSFAVRSEAIPWGTWFARQRAYLEANFTGWLGWVVLGVLVFRAGRWLWSRSRGARPRSSFLFLPPGVFIGSSFATAFVWLLAFRQGSFIHKYWQFWLCLPAAALLASFLASLNATRLGLGAGSAGCVALVVVLLLASRASYAGVRRDQLGTPEDIAFLTSLRDDRFSRLVFVPVSETPLNQWFTGPLFEYYTDRGVVVAAPSGGLNAGEKALVLRYKQRETVVATLSIWSHKRLSNEKCGLRICAYDVLEP